MIPYGRQDITESDIAAVVAVLHSDFLTQGPVVPAFEQAVANYCGAQYATAVNSATSALHLACMALGLGPGDALWTSPITFVASANCARYCGASVDFVDIDPRSGNMDAQCLAQKLALARGQGTLPKIVVPVHFGGQSCDMQAIHALAKEYGFRVIEDASHAIGGRYQDELIGDCRYSDITVFSFHPVKLITTAEGGMALTNDATLAQTMARLRSHDITREEHAMSGPSEGPWYYQQIELGFNYRMTEMQAALGISQMQRLDQYVAARASMARRYDDALVDLPLQGPWNHADCSSARHLYVIRLRLDQLQRGRREIFEMLRARGIGVNVHYIPVHLQPYYRKLGFKEAYCPAAEAYYAQIISLPLFPGLTSSAQQFVIDALREVLA